MRHREPAICLRTSDYSETSQVATFLTRGMGVVRLLAKGTKRPKSKSGGALDLLAEGDLLFSLPRSEGLGTLMEFSESVSHGDLRRKGGTLNVALYMIELTGEMFAESDPHPEMFDLLSRALRRLGQPDAPPQAVLAYFQWRLLRHAGLLGAMDSCVSCGRALGGPARQAGGGELFFSSQAGGVLCGACSRSAREAYRLGRGVLEAMATLQSAEAGQRVSLPEPQARDANRLLAYHAMHQRGKPLRMARHVFGPEKQPAGKTLPPAER